jgi:PEP-CTERM motif
MKNFLILTILSLLFLPANAFADSITFTAPITAGNGNSGTRNPGNSNYEGGTSQFDLDHYRAYTWRIGGVTVQPNQITSATITFRAISNWDTNNNRLFVHMFDSATNFSSANGSRTATSAGGVTSFQDAPNSDNPPVNISDHFANLGSNPLGVSNGPGQNTLLFDRRFYMVDQNGYGTALDYTYTLNASQLAALGSYILNGGNLAFGFDPDCHFWNNGIVFTIQYTPNTPTPEPATLALLGTGLMSVGFYLRRRRSARNKPE